MSHQADKSFFGVKRAWSKRKDVILQYYLEPYLAKVRRLGRPILLVDGFAGPGRYGDGEIGSPLIMCEKASLANRSPGPNVRVLCIEKDAELFETLNKNLSGLSFAEAKSGEFGALVDDFETLARNHSIFLYVDPWRVSHLDWHSISKVASQIQRARASVELLMNFNTPIFVRCALAALKREVVSPEPAGEDIEDQGMDLDSESHEKLSRIVGGDWWKDLITTDKPFHQITQEVIERIGESLRNYFSEVCWLGLKKKREHSIPAYHMVFGSRHSDALELMNDAMIKARGHSDFEIDLFAGTDLDDLILELAAQWVSRGELILQIIRRAFCTSYRAEIRGRIEVLLKATKLESETGKMKINDSTKLRSRL